MKKCPARDRNADSRIPATSISGAEGEMAIAQFAKFDGVKVAGH